MSGGRKTVHRAATSAKRPKAQRVEPGNDQLAFGNQNPLRLAQQLMRVLGDLQGVRKDKQVEAFRLKRKLLNRANKPAGVGKIALLSRGCGIHRHPLATLRIRPEHPSAARHSVGAQRVNRRGRDLDRAVTENIL